MIKCSYTCNVTFNHESVYMICDSFKVLKIKQFIIKNMGNASSNDSGKNKKYAIDYDVVKIQAHAQYYPETKNQKTYFIPNYHKHKNRSKILKLTVKIIDDNVLVYKNDMMNDECDKLIYVSKISNNTSNNMQMVEHYLKFVQVSQDFRLFSIPEFNTVNLYDLSDNIEHPKYVETINVIFDLEPDTKILRTVIENPNHVVDPLKCTLYPRTYTIRWHDKNDEIKKKHMITTYDFATKSQKYVDFEINNILNDTVNFSLNGAYVMLSNQENIKIYDTMNGLISTKKNTELTIPECISNDGNIILCTQKTKKSYDEKYIMELCTNTTHQIKLNYPKMQEINNKIKFYLVNNNQSNIDAKIEEEKLYDQKWRSKSHKIYVLIGWDQLVKIYLFWIIDLTFENEIVSNVSVSDVWKISNDELIRLDYIHHNGNTFIYKTHDEIIIYELDKIVPIKYVDMYSNNYFKLLKKLCEKYYSSKKYYDSLEIVAADDSSKIYQMHKFTKYILSMHTDYNETNNFQVRETSNVNIYGTMKSFDIFQNILTQQSDGSEIIENIVLVRDINGRHNTMMDLMTHMYEYIRVFVLRELNEKKTEKTEFDNIVAIYIGYTLMSFVLKYYLVLSKAQKHETIKYDIIDSFNQNFPIFENFVKESVEILINNGK